MDSDQAPAEAIEPGKAKSSKEDQVLFKNILPWILVGYGLAGLLRFWHIGNASNIAVVFVGAVFVAKAMWAVKPMVAVVESRIALVSTDEDWSAAFQGSFDMAFYLMGKSLVLWLTYSYLIFAASQAARGVFRPFGEGFTFLLAFTAGVFASLGVLNVTVSLWVRWRGSHNPPSRAVFALVKNGTMAWLIAGGLFLVERLFKSTTRGYFRYSFVSVLFVGATVFLSLAWCYLAHLAGKVTTASVQRLCRNTKRLLYLAPESRPILYWYQMVMSVQMMLFVGMGMILSAALFDISAFVSPVVVFGCFTFVSLLFPLATTVGLADKLERSALYQLPRCFMFFVGAYSVIIASGLFSSYFVGHRFHNASVALTGRHGMALVPDYLFAFFYLDLTKVHFWSHLEGIAIGALLALAVSWFIALYIKKDWKELSVGIGLALGTAGIQLYLNHVEHQLDAILNPRFGPATVLMTTLLIPSILVGGYSLLLDHLKEDRVCAGCGETGIAAYAKFCPICGKALAQAGHEATLS